MRRVERGAPEAALVERKDGEAARGPSGEDVCVAVDVLDEAVHEEEDGARGGGGAVGAGRGGVGEGVDGRGVGAGEPLFFDVGGAGHGWGRGEGRARAECWCAW